MKRYLFALICLFGMVAHAEDSPESRYRLVAHRGGVVEGALVENSRPAIEAAIERGYWMVEMDIRETRDGVAIAQHDETFERFYSEPSRVESLDWETIRGLRAEDGTRPLSVAEFADLCQGRLEVMLDIKGPDHSPAFFQGIEDTLRERDLLERALVIGTEQSRRWFLGKALVGANRDELKRAESAGEALAERYFLFEHGNELDAETVGWAQERGILVVPSVNVFHYDIEPNVPHLEGAERDIERWKGQGVTVFQIDTEYGDWF